MRIGVFGGTFDPPHYGHLLLAEFAREQCRLDRVLFTPAALPPHKQARAITSAEHRVAMLHLALGGESSFEICAIEIERGGVSYTVDTLRALHAQYEQTSADSPPAEFFLLMGADMLFDLPNWREPQAVCELAIPTIVRRYDASDLDFAHLSPIVSAERLELMRQHVVTMPRWELSGSEIRRRVAEGLSIRYQLPRAVEEYIRQHGLYV